MMTWILIKRLNKLTMNTKTHNKTVNCKSCGKVIHKTESRLINKGEHYHVYCDYVAQPRKTFIEWLAIKLM